MITIAALAIFQPCSLPPRSVTAPAAMVINPAAGPLILNSDTLKKTVTKPPIMAVSIPIASGKPLAFAMPKLNGNANRNTKKPERTSFFQCFLNKVIFFSEKIKLKVYRANVVCKNNVSKE